MLQLESGSTKNGLTAKDRLQLVGKNREEIATVCGYFEKHAHRMRYDEYLRAGYLVATGVIEGACSQGNGENDHGRCNPRCYAAAVDCI